MLHAVTRSWKWNNAGATQTPGTDMILYYDTYYFPIPPNVRMYVNNDIFRSSAGCVAPISPYTTSYAVDVPGNNAYSGQRLQMWGANGSPAQKFLIQCNVITTSNQLPSKLPYCYHRSNCYRHQLHASLARWLHVLAD